MALRAGYYGLKKKLLEKVNALPGIKSIGDGLSLNSTTGELSATGGGGGTTVVANPEGEATSDLNKLQVGESIYGIPEGTDVEANPSGSATDDLTKLKVGSTIYGISEGTDVEANPSGSATDDLTKLKVGSTIYGIAGGNFELIESITLTDTTQGSYCNVYSDGKICFAYYDVTASSDVASGISKSFGVLSAAAYRPRQTVYGIFNITTSGTFKAIGAASIAASGTFALRNTSDDYTVFYGGGIIVWLI